MKYAKYILIVFLFCITYFASAQNINSLLNSISGGNSSYNSLLKSISNSTASKSTPSASQLQMLGLDQTTINQMLSKQAVTSANQKNTDDLSMLQDNELIMYLTEMSAKQAAMQGRLDSIQAERKEDKEKDLSDQIFGHNFFNSNNLDLFAISTDGKAPDSYIIDEGDEINLAVWGYADYNNSFKVSKDGYIQIPEFGRLYVKGLTFGAVKAQIGKRLSTFINPKNTKYEISLNYARTIDVNIVGEVFKPGTYQIPAINSVYNAINASNGITKIGTVRNIQVRRNGKTVETFDLYKFLLEPNVKSTFFLQTGDFIFVPTADKIVKVAGAIKRPALYELLPNEQLTDLIRYAGGLSADAYLKTIQVTRFTDDKKEIINISLDSLIRNKQDFNLKDGDEIKIISVEDNVENKVSIAGSVRFPNTYELNEGDRISDILIMAGGIKPSAYLDRAYIRRKLPNQKEVLLKFNLKDIILDPSSPENILLMKNDAIRIFSYENFTEKFKVSIDGSVLNPTIIDYAEGLTLNDLIFYAGGLKAEAANSKIEIARVFDFDPAVDSNANPVRIFVEQFEIGENLELDAASKAFPLMPMDKIFVRKEYVFSDQLNVTINGEVKYAGIYPLLDKNEKVLDLIERAGGLTPYAFIKGANLVRQEDNQLKTVFELKDAFKDPKSIANLILKDGDVITIPTVNQMVSIKGAIRYPNLDSNQTISGKFVPGKSIRWYIKNYAGGFKKRANKKHALVQYENGKVDITHTFLGIKNYPTIDNEGATIMVEMKPEKRTKAPVTPREPVSLNILLPSVIASVTSALTTGLLILFIKP
ncbi:MAG: SLBB domain-containing protein [Chitinophagales bacterium]|nr:SLBB domain-containing protein [Chitinophagales bacterium]